MSYINFLISGVGSQQHYTRDHYPKNPTIYYSGTADNFEGHIETTKQDDKTKTILVDKVFTITTLSDKILKKCRNVWSNLQKNTKITFIVTLLGGLAGMAAAVAMGVLSSSLLIPAVGVGAVALAIFAFSFLSLKRSSDAANELKKWTPPAKDLIKKCQELNCRLKAENKLEQAIKNTIDTACNEISILKLSSPVGFEALSNIKIESRLNTLALDIHSLWTTHALKLLNESGMGIPHEKIQQILDAYIEKEKPIEMIPLLQKVKKILLTSVM
jgi:hypothetical protein